MSHKTNRPGPIAPRRHAAAAVTAAAVEPLEPRQFFAAGDLGFGVALSSVPFDTGTTDFGQAVATDAAGNVYLAGAFAGIVDFDPSKGQARMLSAGGRDAFVAKYSPTGKYLWAVKVGGTGFDTASAIEIDNAGRIVVGGSYSGGPDTIDFNPGKGQAPLLGRGRADGFVLTLTSAGKFVRVLPLGGAGDDFVDHLGVDADNNVYAFGTYSGTARFGGKSLTTAYLDDSFAAKIGADGKVQWANVLGGPRTKAGTNDGRAFDAAVAPDGSFAVTGAFIGAVDFRPGKKKSLLNSHGAKTDLYVAKYTTGGALAWARGIGGNGDDVARGVAIDKDGNVISTGTFQQTVDFDPGVPAATLTSAGGTGTAPTEDAFVYKLNAAGNYVWAKRLGAAGAYEEGSAVRTDAQGNVFVAGAFEKQVDFDPGAGTFNVDETATGLGSIFVLKLNAAGAFAYAKAALIKTNTEGFAFASAIDVDASGNAVISGSFSGDLDVDPGAGTLFRKGSPRSSDILLMKLLA